MSKLTKSQAKKHDEATALTKKESLTPEEKEFVREHWQESANHVNSTAGAFFTPPGLASDFSIEVGSGRVIDLCAGIGTLASAVWERQAWDRSNGADPVEIVCVELNPEYAAIGKKLLPEATWIVGSVFDLPDLGRFDCAISNPPFGAVPREGGQSPRYRGKDFEYHVIDIAADIADRGAFIIPQASAGFRLSGARYYEQTPTLKYERFTKQTGITLDVGAGIDTTYFEDDWHGVKVLVEVALADFEGVISASTKAMDDEALFALEAA